MNNTNPANTPAPITTGAAKDTKDRRIVTYTNPYVFRCFKAYAAFYECGSDSAACTDILKKFFDQMPEREKERMLNYSKNSY